MAFEVCKNSHYELYWPFDVKHPAALACQGIRTHLFIVVKCMNEVFKFGGRNCSPSVVYTTTKPTLAACNLWHCSQAPGTAVRALKLGRFPTNWGHSLSCRSSVYQRFLLCQWSLVLALRNPYYRPRVDPKKGPGPRGSHVLVNCVERENHVKRMESPKTCSRIPA